MTRFCLGPLCRDLRPVPALCRYCDECRVFIRRESARRKQARFRERHPERALATARRWYYANRERDNARRLAYYHAHKGE